MTTLLGFNLGIEMTQLCVVAMVMPSLMVLSRTAVYPVLRAGTATLGAILSTEWLAERTGLLTHNPLRPVGEILVVHPFLLTGGLALLALAALAAQRIGYLPAPRTPVAREGERPRTPIFSGVR